MLGIEGGTKQGFTKPFLAAKAQAAVTLIAARLLGLAFSPEIYSSRRNSSSSNHGLPKGSCFELI